MTARRLKRFKVHWRSTDTATRILQRSQASTQIGVPRNQPFSGQTSLTPFFAFLSGVSQRVPSGTKAVATSSNHKFVDPAVIHLLTFSSGLRMLIPGLILVALVPNLILGGLIWLDMINTPWSKHVTSTPGERPAPTIRSAVPLPVLTSPAVLEATAGEQVSLPIALDGTDRVPSRSIIAISGLPQGSTLTSGRPYGDGEWNLKTDEIGDLELLVPNSASGMAKLKIQLVTPDGDIIADTATVLSMAPNPKANITASKLDHTGPQALNERAQESQATDEAESARTLPAAAPAPGVTASVPLPSKRPAPPKRRTPNPDDGGSWIKPSTFVNLREGPSPTSRAISVVAKGAKLRVTTRKKRWVQVTDPATSESGWIYAPKLVTTP